MNKTSFLSSVLAPFLLQSTNKRNNDGIRTLIIVRIYCQVIVNNCRRNGAKTDDKKLLFCSQSYDFHYAQLFCRNQVFKFSLTHFELGLTNVSKMIKSYDRFVNVFDFQKLNEIVLSSKLTFALTCPFSII